MILPRKDTELFFDLFDMLTDYVNGRMGYAPAVIDAKTGFINEQNQRTVAAEMWQHPETIDMFVADNPVSFSADELAQVKNWKLAYTDTFSVQKDDDGTLYFYAQGYAFAVTGLSREIVSMLNRVPTLVRATLLPFAGKVVYDGFLEELPIAMGKTLLTTMEDELDDALEAGHVVSSATDFMMLSAHLKELRMQREASMMLEDLEAEMNPEAVGPGMHRGALAGLSDDERTKAISEYYKKDVLNSEGLQAAYERVCFKRKPVESLHDCVMLLRRSSLVRIARQYGMSSPSNKNKTQLTHYICEKLLARPEDLPLTLSGMTSLDVDAVRRLSDAGGKMEWQSTPELGDFVPSIPPLSYTFYHQGVFTSVMPQELRPLVATFDWDGIAAKIEEAETMTDIACFLADLRGIVTIQELGEELRERAHIAVSDTEVLGWLLTHPDKRDLNFDLWAQSIDAGYLVHYTISEYLEDMVGSDKESDVAKVEEGLFVGELPVEAEGLLSARKGIAARPLTEEMLTTRDYLDWVTQRPAVVTLRNFLDGHVPDDKSDYAFADDIVDEVCTMITSGERPEGVASYLAESGLDYDTVNSRKLFDLLTNAINVVPQWVNNGWTPMELLEQREGRKIFYNPDGSVMKVGRNDPCPCGSGKKYKKCHGRDA